MLRNTMTTSEVLALSRPSLDEVSERVEAFVRAKREQWAADDERRRSRLAELSPVPGETALRAWERYRLEMLEAGCDRRSLRKRDFLAGYEAASR